MNRLKTLRKEQNLTLIDLSEQLGIPKSTLNRYENGDSEPKQETWELLSDFFEVDTSFLMGLSEIRKASELNISEKIEEKDIPKKVQEYFDELMTTEIENGDQRYKLFYDLTEKSSFEKYLITKEFPKNETGIKYAVKEFTEKFLAKYYDLQRYLPHSNENAISYSRNKIDMLLSDINNYFKSDEESRKSHHSRLEEDEIKDNLSYDLYDKIISGLKELDYSLYEMDRL